MRMFPPARLVRLALDLPAPLALREPPEIPAPRALLQQFRDLRAVRGLKASPAPRVLRGIKAILALPEPL